MSELDDERYRRLHDDFVERIMAVVAAQRRMGEVAGEVTAVIQAEHPALAAKLDATLGDLIGATTNVWKWAAE